MTQGIFSNGGDFATRADIQKNRHLATRVDWQPYCGRGVSYSHPTEKVMRIVEFDGFWCRSIGQTEYDLLPIPKRPNSRPKVYVAGPISKGNQFQNCAKAIRLGSEIHFAGASPYIPHLSALWDFVDGDLASIGYEDWMVIAFDWITSCDILFRMEGESPGADREVAYAIAHGIPVINDKQELLSTIQSWGAK